MSLKDRLNSAQTPNTKTQEIKEIVLEPKYYETNEETLSVNSLGILDTILADDEINSIFVNGAKNVYIEKKGKTYKLNSTYRDDIQLENIIKKYIKNNETEVKNELFFNFNHQKGINVSITLPPLSNKTTLTLKCYNDKFASFKILQEIQAISKETALFLESFCTLNINVLIIGEKKSLKTTILSSFAKILQNNNRCVILDFLNEINTNKGNCAYFDFSLLKNENEKKITLLKNLIYTKPDKIFINNPDSLILNEIIKISSKTKGVFMALDSDEYNLDKKELYKNFDIVIKTQKANNSPGRISSISQVIEDSTNLEIQEIFSLNDFSELTSSGIVPNIYEDIKLNSLPINQNIFDKDYRHTYYKDVNLALNTINKKNINLDILKKFKKDLAIIEEESNKELENNQKEEIQTSQEIEQQNDSTPLDILNKAIEEESNQSNNEQGENI